MAFETLADDVASALAADAPIVAKGSAKVVRVASTRIKLTIFLMVFFIFLISFLLC